MVYFYQSLAEWFFSLLFALMVVSIQIFFLLFVVKGEGKSMIYKCTNCDAALKYNPSLRLLECDNCCSVFRVEDVTPYEEEGEVAPERFDDGKHFQQRKRHL